MKSFRHAGSPWWTSTGSPSAVIAPPIDGLAVDSHASGLGSRARGNPSEKPTMSPHNEGASGYSIDDVSERGKISIFSNPVAP